MHLLTIGEMPSHRHAIQFREGQEGGTGNNYSDINGGINQTGYTDFEGGSNAHNNMPPYYTIQFIIKSE